MGKLKKILRAGAGIAAAALGLAACAPSGDSSAEHKTTVFVRVWDHQVAAAYRESFAAFTAKNPDIAVRVNVVPWSSYWDDLSSDVSDGRADDIYWLNSSNFGAYADAGRLLNVSEELEGQEKGWQPSVVDQFTREGSLWGVPQLSDAVGMFYNKKLVGDTDVVDLRWSPDIKNDSFLATALHLTKDSAGITADEHGFAPASVTQYGYNAALDLQAIYYNFVGSNGGGWQSDDDRYVFADDPKTVEAMQYVVDLVNQYKVAPPAASTNEDSDFSLNQFTAGRMALFQSGTYNMKNIADAAHFDWGVAPIPSGPAGRVTLANGIIAAGNAATDHRKSTLKVLEWLGSEESARYIAADGSAFPAVLGAQEAYKDFWKKKDIDVQPFLDSASGKTIEAPHGPKAAAAERAALPMLKDMFLGWTTVPDGLRRAQKAANDVLKE